MNVDLATLIDWVARIGTVIALATWIIRWWMRTVDRRIIRAFFGGRSITVYLPLRDIGGRRVVAEPDFLAAKLMEAFLSQQRIDVAFEFVSPTGDVDLSRDGLVVICGPKTSPIVRSAMDNDRHLQFTQDGQQWEIRDLTSAEILRSPRDTSGSLADIGYLGRAVRRAGTEQTFLSIAGIHAEGSVAVVSYLCNVSNIRRLYRRTRRSLFSAVMSGDYVENPMRVTSAELVTLRVDSPPRRFLRTDIVAPRV